MTNIYFEIKRPDQLCQKSLDYLEEASDVIGGYFTKDMAVKASDDNKGNIVNVYMDGQLTGCFFIRTKEYHVGLVLEIILLGGECFSDWSQALYGFIINTAKENKADEISIVGRKGWGRLFKELIPMATIFRKKMNK